MSIWVLDAGLDALFFYDRPFLALLITNVPPHEFYIRVVILASFVLFGVVVSRLSTRLERKKRDLGLFRTLLDETADSIFVINPDTGAFLRVNETACDTLGYDRSTLLEMGVDDINPEFEDAEDFQRFSRTEGRTLETYESVHKRADGTTVPVEISASNVTIDGQLYRIAISRDITGRKERKREIQASRERYESLFNSIRDAIVVADTDRHIIDCNPGFVDLFGYALADIEGQPTEVLYADEAEFESADSKGRRRTGDPQFTTTITYETKSGHTFHGETTVSYLRDANGDVSGFIGLIRDISDRHKRLRQIRMIDRVLRHNLHNDMNVILGRAEQIQTLSSGEPVEHAGVIAKRGERLMQTTDKEREVTKILADNPRPTSRDLVVLVTTTVEAVRDRHPAADISIDLPDEQAVLAVDQFEKAIEELVENAIVHSDHEAPSVTVRVERVGETVHLHVADDGPGIPEIERRVLIDGEEIQPLFHGRGFGLWLVNILVDHSNGKLLIDENDPRGTRVTVQLSAA